MPTYKVVIATISNEIMSFQELLSFWNPLNLYWNKVDIRS